MGQAKERAQKAVDRLTAARVEMAAAIEFCNAERLAIASDDADALGFIDQYMNPSAPNPAPIAPAVAAPAPSVEPPVFTTVDSAEVSSTNTSGGSSDVAEELTVVDPPAAG